MVFVHHITDINLWRMFCTGFRHSAVFHARVVLDGATCRLGGLGEVGVMKKVTELEQKLPSVVWVRNVHVDALWMVLEMKTRSAEKFGEEVALPVVTFLGP